MFRTLLPLRSLASNTSRSFTTSTITMGPRLSTCPLSLSPSHSSPPSWSRKRHQTSTPPILRWDEQGLIDELYNVDHTMFRIKDAKVSLDFYQRILGMELSKSFRSLWIISKLLLMVEIEYRVQFKSPLEVISQSEFDYSSRSIQNVDFSWLNIVWETYSYFLAFPEEGKEGATMEEKKARKWGRWVEVRFIDLRRKFLWSSIESSNPQWGYPR